MKKENMKPVMSSIVQDIIKHDGKLSKTPYGKRGIELFMSKNKLDVMHTTSLTLFFDTVGEELSTKNYLKFKDVEFVKGYIAGAVNFRLEMLLKKLK